MPAMRFQACHIRTAPATWSVFVAEQDGKAAALVAIPGPTPGAPDGVLPVVLLELSLDAGAEHAVRSTAA